MARKTVKEKLALISEWSALNGESSQREFCKGRNLTPSTFNKWVRNLGRLRETAASKKNAQRAGTHVKERRVLEEHINRCFAAGGAGTVIDLMAFTRKHSIIPKRTAYLSRYMFCRRVLLAYVLKNPQPVRGVVQRALVAGASEGGNEFYYQAENVQFVAKMIFIDKPPRQRRINYGVCSCTRACSPEEGCENRNVAEDCNEKNCSSAGKCDNRWSTNTLDRLLEVFRTKRTGLGLRTKTAIPSGSVVIQYVGEYMKLSTYKARCDLTRPTMTYFMKCDKSYGVDARHYGNLSGFINNACRPNLVPEMRVVDRTTRVFLVAARDIPALEELTFCYDKTTEFTCMCSAHGQ